MLVRCGATRTGFSYTDGVSINLSNQFEKLYYKVEHLSYDPEILILDIYLQKSIYMFTKKKGIRIFIAPLFIIVNRETTQMSINSKWINCGKFMQWNTAL